MPSKDFRAESSTNKRCDSVLFVKAVFEGIKAPAAVSGTPSGGCVTF